ncbi:MAG: HIT family protein [Candidatus Woesearchaeota archaeon]
MTDCEYCKIAEKEKTLGIVYEDELCTAFVDDKPAMPGQVTLIPKRHYPIIETVPDETIEHMFNIANKLSTILFEVIGAKGTNILIQNGPSAGQDVAAHVSINIIPRQDNDNLDLQWDMSQASEDDLSTAELMLKEETKKIVDGKEKEPPKPQEINTEGENIETKDGEKDYMIEQLNRTP